MSIYIPPHRDPKQVRDIWSALAILTFVGSILYIFAVIVS